MTIYQQPVQQSHHIRSREQLKEEKSQRLAANRANKEYRQGRAYRMRYKGAKNDVELANIFMQFGIDYLSTPKDQLYTLVRDKIEGINPHSVSVDAIDFLVENFDAEIKYDPDMRKYIHFSEQLILTEEEETGPMRLYTQIAERCGETRKVVRIVYEALVKQARSSLRHERYFRLPELGRLRIKYSPPREKRWGKNPFNPKKKMLFKAKDASNKVRFSVAKQLKVFVANKVEVVPPPKKKKKG